MTTTETQKQLIVAIIRCKSTPENISEIHRELNCPDENRGWWWWDFCPETVKHNWKLLSYEAKLTAMLMGGTSARQVLANIDD